MTNDQINALEASRELDARIAREVLGLDCRKADAPVFTYEREWIAAGEYYLFDGRADFQPERSLPHYSTDIAAAWQVIEYLAAQGWLVQVDNDEEDWHCYIGGYSSLAATAPLAICRTALKMSVA